MVSEAFPPGSLGSVIAAATSATPSPSTRISAAFEELAKSAKTENVAFAQLVEQVESLEHALAIKNVRVAAWTKISEWSDDVDYYNESIGYIRLSDAWHIAIQTSRGEWNRPEDQFNETWAFAQAPHHLCVKAVDKLPDLIEALVHVTNATTERIQNKLAPTQDLVAAVAKTLTPKKK